MADKQWSKRKLLSAAAIIFVCSLAGYFVGEPLRISEKPSEYIAVLFSILAASVFAVISIVGDPIMLLPGGRRIAWENAKSIQIELQKLNDTFTLHILTLLLLIVSEIVEAMCWERFYFLYNVLAFSASLGFLLTFSLPHRLSKIQRDRLDREIRSRK